MKGNIIAAYFFMLAGVILAGYFGPWWAPAAFVVLMSALMQLPLKKAILAGGISIGVVYLAMSIWMNSADESGIIGKTGVLLGGLSPFGFIITTMLIGAITGMLSGWVGCVLGEMLKKGDRR